MDWKGYYEAELLAPGARERAKQWICEAGDPRVAAAIDRLAILSFPHTALSFSGPMQAEVVSALYRSGVDEVIALGVLHSGVLPAYRRALDAEVSESERDEAFAVVRGAFVPPEPVATTPFGDLHLLPTAEAPIRSGHSGILAAEFSLDTFLAMVRLGAEAFGRPPLRVLPVYVGMTREPSSGSFDAACELADWLKGASGPGTAVVTTGDLVHLGNAYGWTAEDVAAASRGVTLDQTLRGRVDSMLQLAFGGEMEEAYRSNLEALRNDQREILPVLVEHLSPNQQYGILAFQLSNYAPILGVEPPCWVASALVAYG